MNIIKKILISIFGGADVLINVITPILLVFLWIKFSGLTNWSSILLYVVGLCASMFRATKFWINKNE